MSLNSPLKRTLPALSLTLLITSCASTPNLTPNNAENNDNYWYCAPGDQRTWRCAEDKEALGLSYYRPWKTTLDSEVEQFESEDVEQDADEPVMVQGVKLLPVEDLSEGSLSETVEEPAEETVEDALSEEALVQGFSTQEGLEQTAAETAPAYGKVLQLAAYHSQSQARSFVDSLDDKLSIKPNLIRTQVNGQIYYTVVFDQLSSQQDVEQLIAELAESFPTIQPWLRSRSGFAALRAD